MPNQSNENGENIVSRTIINHFSKELLEKQKELRERAKKSLMTKTDREKVYSHTNAMS